MEWFGRHRQKILFLFLGFSFTFSIIGIIFSSSGLYPDFQQAIEGRSREKYLRRVETRTSFWKKTAQPFMRFLGKFKGKSYTDEDIDGTMLDYGVLDSLNFPVPKNKSEWHDQLGLHFLEDASRGLDTNGLMKAVAKRTLHKRAIDLSREHHLMNYTLEELMKFPSKYSNEKSSSTTVILNHWKRPTLEIQLQALLNQSLAPECVWVCLFHSDREPYYREIVERYKPKFNGELYLVVSDFNFKYYGRFQVALQAHTKFVWIIDDDILPGSKYLEILTYVAGIEHIKGAFGSVGWINPYIDIRPNKRRLPSYREPGVLGGLYIPDMRYRLANQIMMEADLLCSQWFLETDSVRLLFRERWVTFETAEDFHLAYSLRKFANSPSYILPVDLTDSRTWGNTDLSQDLQGTEGTTTMDMVKVRIVLWCELVMRGGQYFWFKYKERPKASSRVLLLIDSPSNLEPAANLYKRMHKAKKEMDRPQTLLQKLIQFLSSLMMIGSLWLRSDLMVAFSSLEGSICEDFFLMLDIKPKSVGKLCQGKYHGVFELRIGGDFPMAMKARHIYYDLIKSTSEVINSANIGAIIRLKDDESIEGRITTDALERTAKLNKLPILQLSPDEVEIAPWLTFLPPSGLEGVAVFSYSIMVVADPTTRAEELSPFLTSLVSAYYLGLQVDCVLVGPSSFLASTDFIQNSIQWPHGRMAAQVKLRSKLYFSHILESWTPNSDKDFLILPWDKDALPSNYFSLLTLYILKRIPKGKNVKDTAGLCLKLQSSSVFLFSFFDWKELQTTCKQANCDDKFLDELFSQLKRRCIVIHSY